MRPARLVAREDLRAREARQAARGHRERRPEEQPRGGVHRPAHAQPVVPGEREAGHGDLQLLRRVREPRPTRPRARSPGTGIELVALVPVADVRRGGPGGPALGRPAAGRRGLVVAGSAGPALWRAFRARVEAHRALWDAPHPYDAFVAALLGARRRRARAAGVALPPVRGGVPRPGRASTSSPSPASRASARPARSVSPSTPSTARGGPCAARGSSMRDVDPPLAHRPPCAGCSAPCVGGWANARGIASRRPRCARRCVVGPGLALRRRPDCVPLRPRAHDARLRGARDASQKSAICPRGRRNVRRLRRARGAAPRAQPQLRAVCSKSALDGLGVGPSPVPRTPKRASYILPPRVSRMRRRTLVGPQRQRGAQRAPRTPPSRAPAGAAAPCRRASRPRPRAARRTSPMSSSLRPGMIGATMTPTSIPALRQPLDGRACAAPAS